MSAVITPDPAVPAPGWWARLVAWCGSHPREARGYLVWGVATAVVAVPELTAALWEHSPWPTISTTVGQLELHHGAIAIIPVVLIVLTSSHVYAPRQSRHVTMELGIPLARGRTAGNRRTRQGGSPSSMGLPYLYATLAFMLVPACIAVWLFHNHTVSSLLAVGLILWLPVGLVCVVIPSILAHYWAKDVPFPRLWDTVGALEDRLHWLAVTLLALLVVLLLHLAFYPWPNIAHILQPGK
jgi:hypothetical protein